MTGDALSAQQVEILARMKQGWKLSRIHEEFPFVFVLTPPSGKGGIYYQNSPVQALAKRGVILMGPNGICLNQ